QKKASSAAACANGMRVPRRTTPWASVALNSPASSPSSSSRGKKTGSARGAHRVTAVEVQYRALSRWANPAALAAAWLQLPTTRRPARPVSLRLSCHVSRGAALHNVAERLRLQLLHRFEDRVLDLRQSGLRMGVAPLR